MHANSPAWQEQQQPLTRLATERTTPRDGIHKVCVVVAVVRCQIPERFQQTGDEKNTAVCDLHSLFALVSQSALLGGQERERELHSNWHRIPGKFHPPFVATPNSVHIKIAGRLGRGVANGSIYKCRFILRCSTPSQAIYSWQDENFIRQKKLQRKQGCTYEVLDILVDTISTP